MWGKHFLCYKACYVCCSITLFTAEGLLDSFRKEEHLAKPDHGPENEIPWEGGYANSVYTGALTGTSVQVAPAVQYLVYRWSGAIPTYLSWPVFKYLAEIQQQLEVSKQNSKFVTSYLLVNERKAASARL